MNNTLLQHHKTWLLLLLLSSITNGWAKESVLLDHTAPFSTMTKPLLEDKTPSQNNHSIAVEEYMQTIETPTNPLELLKNLINVLDQRLILQEDFYSEAVIRKLTGGQNAEAKILNDHKRSAAVIDFRTIADVVDAKGDDGWVVSYALDIDPSGKKHLRFSTHTRIGQTKLPFDLVMPLIQRSWERSPYRHIGTEEKYRPPTGPHGNEKWEYYVSSEGINERGYINYDPAGQFDSLTVFVETK